MIRWKMNGFFPRSVWTQKPKVSVSMIFKWIQNEIKYLPFPKYENSTRALQYLSVIGVTWRRHNFEFIINFFLDSKIDKQTVWKQIEIMWWFARCFTLVLFQIYIPLISVDRLSWQGSFVAIVVIVLKSLHFISFLLVLFLKKFRHRFNIYLTKVILLLRLCKFIAIIKFTFRFRVFTIRLFFFFFVSRLLNEVKKQKVMKRREHEKKNKQMFGTCWQENSQRQGNKLLLPLCHCHWQFKH